MDATTQALINAARLPSAVLTVVTATLFAVNPDGSLVVDIADGSGAHTVRCAGHANYPSPALGPVLLGYSQGAHTVLAFLAAPTGGTS